MSILDIPFIARVRQNHALEHATMHMLTRRSHHLSLVGRSDWNGYSIYGQVETEALASAATEALQRLQAGEHDLAVHPRCGTVLATGGILAGLSAFAVMLGKRPRSRWARLPEVLVACTAALLLAQPLGLMLQEHITTSSDIDNLMIKRISRKEAGGLVIHRIETAVV
jgi:hypothetical protein